MTDKKIFQWNWKEKTLNKFLLMFIGMKKVIVNVTENMETFVTNNFF